MCCQRLSRCGSVNTCQTSEGNSIDLDLTLLPNGSWPPDHGAIDLFNELTERHDVPVVDVTGRNLNLTENAIEKYGIRHPHVLISDVGSSIRKYGQGGWVAYVKQASPGWDAEAICDTVAGVDGMTDQEHEHRGPFKQSYYMSTMTGTRPC